MQTGPKTAAALRRRATALAAGGRHGCEDHAEKQARQPPAGLPRAHGKRDTVTSRTGATHATRGVGWRSWYDEELKRQPRSRRRPGKISMSLLDLASVLRDVYVLISFRYMNLLFDVAAATAVDTHVCLSQSRPLVAWPSSYATSSE